MKGLFWIGSSKKDLKAMPGDVQDTFGYALSLAQAGQKRLQAKPMHGRPGWCHGDSRGFSGWHVSGRLRGQGGRCHYVLHGFQKKSTKGISTPKPDMDLIRERLKAAQELAKEQGK